METEHAVWLFSVTLELLLHLSYSVNSPVDSDIRNSHIQYPSFHHTHTVFTVCDRLD